MQPGEEALKQWMVMGLAGDSAAHGQLLRALVPILRGFYRRRMGGQEDEIEDLLPAARPMMRRGLSPVGSLLSRATR